MSEIYESSLQLHDLCEDVFHKILVYIPRMHLYFSVRNVCKAMRQKVDGFISLIGKFVIATRDKPPTDNLACFVTMFYVFKTRADLCLSYQGYYGFFASKPLICSVSKATSTRCQQLQDMYLTVLQAKNLALANPFPCNPGAVGGVIDEHGGALLAQ